MTYARAAKGTTTTSWPETEQKRFSLAAAHSKEKVIAIVVNAGYTDEILLLDIAKRTAADPSVSVEVLEMPEAASARSSI